MHVRSCMGHIRKRSYSRADGDRSRRSTVQLPCFVTEAAGSNFGLDCVCSVGDCHHCHQSVQENSLEVHGIGFQWNHLYFLPVNHTFRC